MLKRASKFSLEHPNFHLITTTNTLFCTDKHSRKCGINFLNKVKAILLSTADGHERLRVFANIFIILNNMAYRFFEIFNCRGNEGSNFVKIIFFSNFL